MPNEQTPTNSTHFTAKRGTHPQPHMFSTLRTTDTTIPNPRIAESNPTSHMPTPHRTPTPTYSHAPKQPTRANPHTPLPHISHPTKPNYTHQSIKALTLNTRGMHTTIIDLQNILSNQTDPHIIAVTETNHRHIKFIWRQTLKNYKLVYSPSLYNKKHQALLRRYHPSNALKRPPHHKAPPRTSPISTVSRHRPLNTQNWLRTTCHLGQPLTASNQTRNPNTPGHPTLAPHTTNN